MDIEAELVITENEDGAVIDITGDKAVLGAIIGRRGETLDAVQYLASMASNKNEKGHYRRACAQDRKDSSQNGKNIYS